MSDIGMEKTEYWIRPGHGKAIALLHGIGAKDPQDYWRAFLSVLSRDEQLQEFGLFVWKYPTHVQPGGVRNVLDMLKGRTLRETAPKITLLGAAWNTTYHAQLGDYQEVVLVCHSMGGLVVKSWIIDTLERGQSTSLETLRHIAFYATPHNGAPITTLARWNKQLRDMQLDSPFIEDVGRRWHDHVVAWKEKVPGPSDRLYNRYVPHVVIAGLNDRVVPSPFATIRGMPMTTIQGDHSQVIQPTDASDTRYKVWRSEIEKTRQMKSEAAPPSSGILVSMENRGAHTSPEAPPNTRQPTNSSPYHSCILSYATEDQAFAEKLHSDLQKRGISCWFAPHDLKTGDKLRDQIYAAIRNQDKLLLILSKHAITSKWVEEEVDAALDREHQQPGTYLLFPIRLDDQVFHTEKAWGVAVRQRFIGDFHLWTDDAEYQRALLRLLRDLHA